MKVARKTDDVEVLSKGQKFILVSTFDPSRTQVFHRTKDGARGERLWKMEDYVGKRRAFLSPDGVFLVLVGDSYLGNYITTGAYLKMGENPLYIEVFQSGKSHKAIRHSDIFQKSVKHLVKTHDLRAKGGGWVGMGQLLTNSDDIGQGIDWTKKTLRLELVTGTKKTVSF
ncbi:MAG: hypothetical protein AAF203_07365 [Pseudomonadota bacterium]